MARVAEGLPETEISSRKTASLLGRGPAAAGGLVGRAGVQCSVVVRVQVGGRDARAWGEGGSGSGAELSSPRRKLLLGRGAGGAVQSLLLL